MGWLGSREIAAHQIAINLASLTFMMPLGISGAASVLVGRAIGAKQMQAARRYAVLSLASAAAVMACASIVLLAFPKPLAELYTNQMDVITIAILLIPMAGIFQVFDGLQVVASGVLRGAADTRGPMVINVLGFWLAGMPTAVYLAFVARVGPVGLWWGLVVGLATVSMLLLLRVIRLLQNPISRVQIDLTPAGSVESSSQISPPEVAAVCAGESDPETLA
jgi:MATE family multidrug resistance protein